MCTFYLSTLCLYYIIYINIYILTTSFNNDNKPHSIASLTIPKNKNI